ncbi:MAG: KTSC domain-containing protein [Clostridia bacterium]|nr:KTSC domain-containing protein [Clostridia bacterium]
MKKSVDGTIVEMISVESKTLATVGYNDEEKVLSIEFCRGPVYVYNEVPKSVYERLISEPSPDDYFNENIKNGYNNRRVW